MATMNSQARVLVGMSAWWRTCKSGIVQEHWDAALSSSHGTITPRTSFSLDEALLSLDRLADPPSMDVFIGTLQKCRNDKRLDSAQCLLSIARRHGLEAHRDVGNHLVPMFVECGSLLDAQQLFDRLEHHNVHSWTSLISGYVQTGQLYSAFSMYFKMQEDHVYPNNYTLVAVLKACKCVEDIQAIHVEIAEKGFERDLFIGSSLIDIYAKYGAVLDAHAILNKLSGKNIISWTALIAGYGEHGPGSEALKCFEQMKLQGVAPNDVTHMSVLKACGSWKLLDDGRALQLDMMKKGLGEDEVVGSSMVDMYAKCRSMAEARKTLDNLQARDIVSWNALLAGYAEHGPGQEVLNCLEEMQSEKVLSDEVTYVYALKACANMGAIDHGQDLHAEISHRGLNTDSFIDSALVDMYAKFGLLTDARYTFGKISVRDVVSWNAIIKGCGMNHEGAAAVEYFEMMRQQGLKPDAVTFTCVLSACSHGRLVSKAQEIFKLMKGMYGIIPTTDHYNCMVDILSRAGRIYEAVKFIESMPCSPSIDMWTALLTACKMHAETDLGLKCFEQLVQMKPEWAVPYVLMGNVYGSAGRWEDARRMEELRKQAGAKKKPASALIEVNRRLHEFVVGKNASREVSEMLENLSTRMEGKGRVPNVELVMGLLTDNAKEAALCDHAEKLALAFGLLNTPPGHTLRITKNMRMCSDCHNTSKAISKTERREIIVREVYQVHRFKNGLCSCGDIS